MTNQFAEKGRSCDGFGVATTTTEDGGDDIERANEEERII